MVWCMQCGTENQPRLAVGVDEDGEPACVAHKVRTFEEINRAKPRESKPVPVQPETSKAMADRQCPGVLGKTCGATIGPRSEVCTKCYARRLYHQSKTTQSSKKVVRKPTAMRMVRDETVQTAPSDLTQLRFELAKKLEAVDAVLAMLNKAS